MNERQGSNPRNVLTAAEKRKLASIKRLRGEEFGKEALREKEFDSVPLITERTCNVLRYSLNMDNPQRMDPQGDLPFYRASNMSDSYLSNFFNDKSGTGTRSMYDNLKSWLNKEFSSSDYEDYAGCHSAATVGVGLVLKAFEQQYGEKFIENLRKVDPGEMLRVIDGQKIQELANKFDVFEKIENVHSGIPLDQLFLRSFIEDFADTHSGDYGFQLEIGANLGYVVIQKLWPKLKPRANSQKA